MFCQQQGMPMAAPPAAATAGDCDAAPVPWLAFAADDKGDDLDADLAQLITLPGDIPKQNSSSKSSSSPASKPKLPSIKRVNSTSSAYSSGEALAGAAAAPLIGSSAAAGSKAGSISSSTKQQPKVLRIRSIKGAPGSAGKPAAGSKVVSSTGKAPAGPSCKSSTNSKPGSTSINQQKAAATGLGPAKAGVQKKVVAAGGNSSSKVKLANTAAAPAHKQQVKLPLRSTQQKATLAPAAAAPKAAVPAGSPVKAASMPAPPAAASPKTTAAADESTLSLLGDLDSGLSDTCFGSSGDDMAIDSFAYLDELLLQESSEDAWEGLLGGSATAEEMELCSSLASH
jgi:hypothetical protein